MAGISTNYYLEVCYSGNCAQWYPTPNGASLVGLNAWEASTGVGDGGGSCGIWQAGVLWYTGGYAPSGVNMPNLNTSPATCTAQNGAKYSGGSALWFNNGYAYTLEASNLIAYTWFQRAATNFYYALQV